MTFFPAQSAKKILTGLLVTLYLCLGTTFMVQAATVTQPDIIPAGSTGNEKLYIPHNTDQVSNKTYLEERLLPGIASTIIGLVGGLSLLFVIISGIQLLTSYGNGDAMGKAKKTLIWAVAGIVIASLSYAIVKIISTINIPT